MFWKIRFRVDKSLNSPISTIRIDAETLREACIEVMGIYRNATILTYQEDNGEVISFDSTQSLFESFPVDPIKFSRNKEEMY
jgi:hypothetical protein